MASGTTTELKEGDRVQIVSRELTAEDAKNNLYYSHFAGLTGTITKLFATQEASIEIDVEALPEAIGKRHLDFQDNWRNRWLDGLSEEGRNRLSVSEREFNLRYCVLVSIQDLVPASERIAIPSSLSRATEEDLNAAEQAELERRRRA